MLNNFFKLYKYIGIFIIVLCGICVTFTLSSPICPMPYRALVFTACALSFIFAVYIYYIDKTIPIKEFIVCKLFKVFKKLNKYFKICKKYTDILFDIILNNNYNDSYFLSLTDRAIIKICKCNNYSSSNVKIFDCKILDSYKCEVFYEICGRKEKGFIYMYGYDTLK